MPTADRCLVDTNILLRMGREPDPMFALVSEAVAQLGESGTELCYSLQNIAELWSVCTRPNANNGFGLSIGETESRVNLIEQTMRFVPDNEQVYSLWRQLVVAHNVRGIQVHDAHLVATMQAHGITHILTLNSGDFARFTEIQAVHPSEVSFETE